MERIERFEKHLVDFIQTNQRSCWIVEDFASVYVRRSARYHNERAMQAFDLATVDVDETCQNQGLFKAMMQAVEKIAKKYAFEAVFIENVLNQIVIPHIERSGYERYVANPTDMCFIKVL